MKRIDQINPKLLDGRLIGADTNRPKAVKIPQYEFSDENMKLLQQAERYFADMKDFYARRKRVREYVRGNQWGDYINNPDGTLTQITEEDYIKLQGKVPLKQNLMRNFMRNLSGQFQSNPIESNVLSIKRADAKVGEMYTNTLKYAMQVNSGTYLTAREFDEFMISGMPVNRVTFKYMSELERPDLYFENIDPRTFFLNTDIKDPRLNDLRFIGRILDVPMEKLISEFAKTPEQGEKIKSLYVTTDTYDNFSLHSLKPDNVDNMDFYVPVDTSMARLIEIWYQVSVWGLLVHDPMDPENGWEFIPDGNQEDIDNQNALRIAIALQQNIPQENVSLIEATKHNAIIWRFKFLTPNAYCLLEGDTPYEHGEHPFTVHAYPMIDGQIWGPLEDILDQQRNINRYITQLDFINSANAKGVWIIPEESKPDDINKEEFVSELSRIGGAVWVKLNTTQNPQGLMPKQMFANAQTVGITELLNIQIRLMQEISGIQPSIQGMPAKSGTPASLYAQEAQNAATNVLDFINSFGEFIRKRDTKILKTIIQFYKEKRLLHIAGTDYEKEAMEYDPELVDGFNFDLVVAPGNNSPIYRQAMDQMLLELLQMSAINIEQYLENTSMPYADKLLESIHKQQADIAAGQQATPPPQELVDQINNASNPKAMALINKKE